MSAPTCIVVKSETLQDDKLSTCKRVRKNGTQLEPMTFCLGYHIIFSQMNLFFTIYRKFHDFFFHSLSGSSR